MNKKVLVADDDPVVRILVSEFLSSKGYQVDTLDSGGACLEYLKQEVPDVLLLDLLMPDMTGIEVLRTVRNDPRTSRLPIVMLSADTDTESVISTNDLSADAYVQKPFGMNEIISIMEQIVK